jgi:ubiquinone/menaquinone biosynthesis C-methylase UbiE
MQQDVNRIDPTLLNKVKKSNQQFYDIISDSYETVDGKRDKTTIRWITKKLRTIQRATKGETLLDIGCGSGFILRYALPYFKTIVGIDISFAILKGLRKQGYLVVCADIDHLPFKNDVFSVVSCFAVLHHLYIYTSLTEESYRILKTRGIFYSDHDLDSTFEKRFRFFMQLYRTCFNEKKKYLRANSNITSELYHFTEIHHKGIKTDEIAQLFKKQKFSEVRLFYHWLGLFPLLTRFCLFFNIRSFRKGNAPLVSIIAKK